MADVGGVPQDVRAAFAAGSWRAVDLVVERPRGTDASELMAHVENAVTRASAPSGQDAVDLSVHASTDSGPAGSVLVAVTNPSGAADAGQAWIGRFLDALRASPNPVQVRPVRHPSTIADLWDLAEGPPQLTGFLSFTTSHEQSVTTGPDPAILRDPSLVDALASWLRFPGADIVRVMGGEEERVSPARLREALIEAWPDELNRFFTADLASPRRMRTVAITYPAHGHVQLVDVTRDPTERLALLLDAWCPFSAWVDYAFVRYAGGGAPDLRDIPLCLGRPWTAQEDAMGSQMTSHLLSEYVPDAYVAQILTENHLARAGDLAGFTVEPLTPGRYLVQSTEPARWLQGPNPPNDLLTEARRQFRAMIMTEDVMRASPPPWLRPS
ncbi:MAG: hypothetical protein IE926_03305 [Micrococcales bacterium]|nr:hypothetical protein [Micrococcales bacterium]